jgi:hypothetical protein
MKEETYPKDEMKRRKKMAGWMEEEEANRAC